MAFHNLIESFHFFPSLPFARWPLYCDNCVLWLFRAPSWRLGVFTVFFYHFFCCTVLWCWCAVSICLGRCCGRPVLGVCCFSIFFSLVVFVCCSLVLWLRCCVTRQSCSSVLWHLCVVVLSIVHHCYSESVLFFITVVIRQCCGASVYLLVLSLPNIKVFLGTSVVSSSRPMETAAPQWQPAAARTCQASRPHRCSLSLLRRLWLIYRAKSMVWICAVLRAAEVLICEGFVRGERVSTPGAHLTLRPSSPRFSPSQFILFDAFFFFLFRATLCLYSSLASLRFQYLRKKSQI